MKMAIDIHTWLFAPSRNHFFATWWQEDLFPDELYRQDQEQLLGCVRVLKYDPSTFHTGYPMFQGCLSLISTEVVSLRLASEKIANKFELPI